MWHTKFAVNTSRLIMNIISHAGSVCTCVYTIELSSKFSVKAIKITKVNMTAICSCHTAVFFEKRSESSPTLRSESSPTSTSMIMIWICWRWLDQRTMIDGCCYHKRQPVTLPQNRSHGPWGYLKYLLLEPS